MQHIQQDHIMHILQGRLFVGLSGAVVSAHAPMDVQTEQDANVLVSIHFPANAGSGNSMPESINSLPVGDPGLGESPLATTPNAQITIAE